MHQWPSQPHRCYKLQPNHWNLQLSNISMEQFRLIEPPDDGKVHLTSMLIWSTIKNLLGKYLKHAIKNNVHTHNYNSWKSLFIVYRWWTITAAITLLLGFCRGGHWCFFVSLRLIFEFISTSISHQSDPTCNPHFLYMCARTIRLHLGVPPKLGAICTPCIHFACSRTDWCVQNSNTPPCFCIFTMRAVMLFACVRVVAVIPSDGSCACVFFRRPRPRGTGVLPGWLQCGFH